MSTLPEYSTFVSPLLLLMQQKFYQYQEGFPKNEYFAIVRYQEDFPRVQAEYETNEEAFRINFYKTEEDATKEFWKLKPVVRYIELWSNGQILEKNR